MKIFFLCVFLVWFKGGSTQQNLLDTTLSFTHLKAIEPLEVELRKALNYEKKCDDNSATLVWTISLNETDNGCLVVVGMQSALNTDFPYSGFFHLDSTLFVTCGAIDLDLFFKGEKKPLQYSYYAQNPKGIMVHDIEDYSSRIFLFKNKQLNLVEQFVLPCD